MMLAAASAVLRAPIRPAEHGVVLGAGRIAEMTTRVLRAHGFGGLDTEPDPEGGYDFVVEAAGTTAELDRALRLVRPLLTEPDVPWVADSARYLPQGGTRFAARCRTALAAAGRSAVVLRLRYRDGSPFQPRAESPPRH